ncbi:hypothetical protein [Flexivirga sp.]|uniref:hypothetical protein n=1 Tax=Flexivirga sp. TaxID=1962927 RepID=UPI003F7DBC6A
MHNHDTALVITLWVLFVLVAAWIGFDHHRKTRRSVTVERETIRIATRDDLDALLQDPDVPPIVKAIAVQAAHDAGICGCDQPYDQDGELTDTDLDWLESQRGDRR